jgi:S-adenosyl-L-methionine hydrolase (adenosine-forming)
MAHSARPIVFLSDFGLGNEWVGISHAVLNRISPQSTIVDLSHLIRPLQIDSGALLLADAMPYISEEAVVLAVVDPNVGKDREIAIGTASGRYLVGPDNGLLSLAWEAAGGVEAVAEISSPEIVVQPISPSFRTRDTLCPAAAHLASGTALDRLGPAVDPTALAVLEIAEPRTDEPGKIRCQVLEFNRFGNLQLNVRDAHLDAAGLGDAKELSVEAVSGSAVARRGETYADFAPGDYGVIFDPRGWLTIVRGNPASALEGLGLAIGDPVWISAPHAPPGA